MAAKPATSSFVDEMFTVVPPDQWGKAAGTHPHTQKVSQKNKPSVKMPIVKATTC
jgi:hypothetical protein